MIAFNIGGGALLLETIGRKMVHIYPEFDMQEIFWSYATSLKMYAENERDIYGPSPVLQNL